MIEIQCEEVLLLEDNCNYSMDSFTLTDAAGTFAFDGTTGVYTPADGSAPVSFTAAGATAPTTSATPASVSVTDTAGVVYTGTLAAQ
jgi:hypothetical protein